MPRLSKARKALLNTMMKETIFEAANSVLCEHGVAGTTMNRVAEAANLAKSSLYDYFDSKDDLIEFFNSRLVDPCFEILEKTAQSDLSAPKKLENILRILLKYVLENRGILRLLAGAEQSDRIRKSTRPRLLKLLVAIFQQGIDEHSFRPHNPANSGRIFLGSIIEMFELQRDDASTQEVNQFVDLLINLVLNGFSTTPKMEPKE